MFGNMMSYDVAYSSVRGNLHIIRELPNQDAIDVREIGENLVVSIADGHGSNTCFRSDIGAKMAVDVANGLIENNLDDLIQDPEKSKKIATDLCKEVSKIWSKNALNHLSKNAFQDAEVDALDEAKRKSLGRNALLAY